MKSYDDLKTELAELFNLMDALGANNALQQDVMLPLDNLFSKMYVPPEDSVEYLHHSMQHRINSLFASQQSHEDN